MFIPVAKPYERRPLKRPTDTLAVTFLQKALINTFPYYPKICYDSPKSSQMETDQNNVHGKFSGPQRK
jgi:hypothetical protein